MKPDPNLFRLFLFPIMLKFIYSEKITKFCEISNLDLNVTMYDKSTVKIYENFVAFSEYMNFTELSQTKMNQAKLSLQIAYI